MSNDHRLLNRLPSTRRNSFPSVLSNPPIGNDQLWRLAGELTCDVRRHIRRSCNRNHTYGNWKISSRIVVQQPEEEINDV